MDVLRGINSACVDLVYLDPPFNSNRNYEAPIGSKAAGAAFKDTWTLSDLDVAWLGLIADEHPAIYSVCEAAELAHGKGMKSYLVMMAVRLIEIHRILKPTGSIYLHCDPTASHYLKLVLDCIFGASNFRNDITWHYNKWTNAARYFQRNHDVILMYSKDDRYTFNKQYGAPTKRQVEIRKKGYNTGSNSTHQIVRIYDRSNPDVIKKLKSGEWDGRLIYDTNAPLGSPIPDVWDLPLINGQAKERTGYPTQKPLALLERIIQASSNEDDVVLDPFCGCATTMVAAQRLNRQWIGIDISEKAVDLVKTRMRNETTLLEQFNPIIRTDKPHRTDTTPVKPDRPIKRGLFGKQEGACNGCKFAFPFRNYTIDHIFPKAGGGGDEIENLQLLCGACNSKKGDRSMEYLIAELMREGILTKDTKYRV